MKKINFILAISFLFVGIRAGCQNIGINTTGAAGNSSAMLDVSATNKGILIPRVALQSLTDNSTIASPATSLLVYSSGGLIPDGYYYNSGTSGSPIWSTFFTSTSSSGNCLQNVWAQFRLNTEAVATLTTSITYTFTTSASTTKIYVEMWGGGGGGTGLTNAYGGGGGGYAAAYVTVTPSTNYTVEVGGGGLNAVNNSGNNGKNSTFNGTVLVAGGGGGGRFTNGAAGVSTTTLGAGNAILIAGEIGQWSGYQDGGNTFGLGAYKDFGHGGQAGGVGGGKGGTMLQNGSPPGGGGSYSQLGAPGGVIIRW